MSTITKPIILDETGQGIVAKLQGIIDALTPDLATALAAGIVKPDDKTIKVAVDGTISVNIANTAGAHNGIFRGKYLGNALTAEQSAAIQAGNWSDFFIGDYWTINGMNYRIAAIDYYLHSGDTELSQHHLVIVPDDCFYTAKMNDSDTTSGGYAGSKMYSTYLATAKTTINSAFSGHVITFRQLFSNAMASNQASSWAWADCTAFPMNEANVAGVRGFGASYGGWSPGYDVGVDCSQYPLFFLAPEYKVSNYSGARQWWWLRDVVSSAAFAYFSPYGLLHPGSASDAGGVRPAFLIH